jgi:hypothetical protein
LAASVNLRESFVRVPLGFLTYQSLGGVRKFNETGSSGRKTGFFTSHGALVGGLSNFGLGGRTGCFAEMSLALPSFLFVGPSSAFIPASLAQRTLCSHQLGHAATALQTCITLPVQPCTLLHFNQRFVGKIGFRSGCKLLAGGLIAR